MRVLRFLPRFRTAYRALPEMEAREQWSRGDIEAFQLDRLNAVWDHAAAHVPYYRRLRTERRLPSRFGSLAEFRERVPLLTRADVRDRPKDFLSDRAEPGRWDVTSGTTGTPLRVFWPQSAANESVRCRYRLLASWGIDLYDPQVFLWGDGGDSLKHGLGRVFAQCKRRVADRMRNRIRLSAFHLGPVDLCHHLRRMSRFRPASLYAFSSAAYVLAKAAEATGFRCPSMRLAVLTSEPAPPHLVRAVERGFGVPAVNEYGSVERGPVATEGPDRVLRVREDSILIESPTRPDGRHDIVTTALHNHSFPLLRYVSGDVTDTPVAFPDRGFAALPPVGGRENDMLRAASGRIVHWMRLSNQLTEDEGVRRYQAHQRRDGSVSVLVEPTDPAASPDLETIRWDLTDVLEGQPVEVTVVDEIPPTARGKHRWIISDITNGSNGWIADPPEPVGST